MLKEIKQKREAQIETNVSSITTTTSETPYKFRDGAKRHRLQALELVCAPLVTFSRTGLSAADWSRKYRMKVSNVLVKSDCIVEL